LSAKNQRTQYNVPLYKEVLGLWPVLTRELDLNPITALQFTCKCCRANKDPPLEGGQYYLPPEGARNELPPIDALKQFALFFGSARLLVLLILDVLSDHF